MGVKWDKLVCQEPTFIFHRISQRKFLTPHRLRIHALNHPKGLHTSGGCRLTEVEKVYLPQYPTHQNMLNKRIYHKRHFFLLRRSTALLMDVLFALSKACRLYHSAEKMSYKLVLFFITVISTKLHYHVFTQRCTHSHMHAHSHTLMLFTTYFRGNMA